MTGKRTEAGPRARSHPTQLTSAQLAAIPADEITPTPGTDPPPRVSVIMITHNHAAFVEQAVRSVLSQQTPFDVELLIGDDCSDDDTLAICRDLARSGPHRVRLVTSSVRVGMHRNFARLWHRARGDYIAILEGDDYWTDASKLAKQVARLDDDPLANLCGTYTVRVSAGAEAPYGPTIIGPTLERDRYQLEDLICDYSFHTSSVVVRKSAVRLPEWLWEVYCVDRPLYLLAIERGHAIVVPEVTSAYRVHPHGSWSSADRVSKARMSIALFAHIDTHFKGRFARIIKRTLRGILWSYIGEEMHAGNRETARRVLRLARPYWFSVGSLAELRTTVGTWLRLYSPLRRGSLDTNG